MNDEDKALTLTPTAAPPVARPNMGMLGNPEQLHAAMEFAGMLAQSQLVPVDYRNNPANCLVAIQMGFEVGLAPMQAMQNIAVINGRPSMWGDAVLALVKSHPSFLDINEEMIEGKDGKCAGYRCTLKRHGHRDIVRSFTTDDAAQAGLLRKKGPWEQYPQRMLQMRARSWAVRDQFPDVLRGLSFREEAIDITPVAPTDEGAVEGELITTRSDPNAELKDQLQRAGRIGAMSESFASIGVDSRMILERLGHEHIDQITDEDLDALRHLFGMLKKGKTTIEAEFLKQDETKNEQSETTDDAPILAIDDRAIGTNPADFPAVAAKITEAIGNIRTEADADAAAELINQLPTADREEYLAMLSDKLGEIET